MNDRTSMGVVAADLFYTAFAVMFILEEITPNAMPSTTPSYTASISAPWEQPESETDCMLILELEVSPDEWVSVTDSLPVQREFRGGRCVVEFPGKVELPAGNSGVKARYFLLRFPEKDEIEDGRISIGDRSFEVRLSTEVQTIELK